MERKGNTFSLLKKVISLGLLVVFVFLFADVAPVLAQLNSPDTKTLAAASGLSTLDLAILIARIIRAVLSVVGIVLVCLVVYAGWMYMSSQGEKEKIAKSKKIISSAMIGLVIMFASYSATIYILNKLLEAAGLGGVTDTSAQNYSEPLSGSLGSGIIESHYPGRGAIDIPRNTRIMVTFKEPIDPASLIVEADGSAYDADPATTDYVNTDTVLIFASADEDENDEVAEEDLVVAAVSFTEDLKTFVFDPVDLLGNSEQDTNYTVFLSPDIALFSGSAAFTGSNNEGYQWSFEVSTELDLTPPKVTSVVPVPRVDPYDRNITIQINFDDVMDPVASSGTYAPAEKKTFAHVEVFSIVGTSPIKNVEGTFVLTNNYHTVEFVTNDACSKDPCGDTIYCLPATADVKVAAHAASLSEDPPQAEMIAGQFDGLVDAAGNSLDGDGDTLAEGPGDPAAGGDDYIWAFETSDKLNDTAPQLEKISPTISEEQVNLDQDVLLTFNMLMQTSTLNSGTMQLVPDHEQEMWYGNTSATLPTASCPKDATGTLQTCTQVTTDHAAFFESDEEEGIFFNYYPVVTQSVKSAYQICMRPAFGPSETDSSPLCATEDFPFCCDGFPSNEACTTTNLKIKLGQ